MRATRLLTATAIVVAGTLTAAPARADVGDILIQQDDAAGNVICTQDYVVANLALETIVDQTCPGAVRGYISNATPEPITLHTGTSARDRSNSGVNLVVQAVVFGIPFEIISTSFTIDVPGGG